MTRTDIDEMLAGDDITWGFSTLSPRHAGAV
jgi:hypothetical protein